MPWELVIFDCDGVLVDSEPISNGVLSNMLTEIDLPMSPQESIQLFQGRSMASVFEMIESRFGKPVPDGFLEEYYLRMDAEFRESLNPTPGIFEALDGISIPTCVASSGPHRKMRTTLGVTGLFSRFEGRIFSATEVARGKPHPDLFLHAAKSMGASPKWCVVVEDAVPGVMAAIAAGMAVFGYARTSPSGPLAEAGAQVFDNMADLPGLIDAAASGT